MENIKKVIQEVMKRRCVTIGSLSKAIGIEYTKLYKSISPNCNRQLLASEFVSICIALELTLDDFVTDNSKKEQTA